MADQVLVVRTSQWSYEVLKWIGGGGFGQVFKVRRHGKTAACKQIKTSDPGFALIEHQHMTMLCGGPHIVSVHEDVEWNPQLETLSFFMDYYEGKDLEQLVRRLQASGKRFTEVQIIEIAWQIAVALDYCHDKNIWHQDIKTMNILLESKWDPVTDPDHVPNLFVADFGIASQVQTLKTRVTGQRGTPGYQAPEINGMGLNSIFSDKSDIYAFGCILYRLCTLDDPDFAAGIKPLDISPDYSLDLLSLISWMLSHDRDDRPTAIQAKEQIARLIRANIPENYLECRVCHEFFQSRTQLRQHLKKTRHNRSRQGEMPGDDEIVHIATQLKLESPPTSPQDPELRVKGAANLTYEAHSESTNTHDAPYAIPCAMCMRRFQSRAGLWIHLQERHHYRHRHEIRKQFGKEFRAKKRIQKKLTRLSKKG